jgi:hypothetical protein
MNEQIRKLAEEADKLADNQIQMPGEYHPDWGDVRDQKFAQLIVQECAGIITSQDVDPAFKNRMAWAIKEHFGV